jgi:hypothetical protein
MRRVFPALLVATMTLTGCGAVRDSWVNPMNWFGRSQAEAVPEGVNPLIPQESRVKRRALPYAGVPVESIAEVTVEKIRSGALVRATGIAAREGAFEVRLVPVGAPEKGVLSYRLEALYPGNKTVRGAEQARTVTAALALTEQQMEGVKTIRVIGETNARSSSRR